MKKLPRRAYLGHTPTDRHSGIQKGGQHRSVICSQVAREPMQQNPLLGQNECAPWLQSGLAVGWFVLIARPLPDGDQIAALPGTPHP